MSTQLSLVDADHGIRVLFKQTGPAVCCRPPPLRNLQPPLQCCPDVMAAQAWNPASMHTVPAMLVS
jgi:hypothetical protein